MNWLLPVKLEDIAKKYFEINFHPLEVEVTR
jgi:hypothetical protein